MLVKEVALVGWLIVVRAVVGDMYSCGGGGD